MAASVAIIGGGISGLATAHFLGQLGIPSVVMEKSPRLGGLIRTDHVESCVLEAGPDSYLAAKPAVTELARDLNMSEQIIGSNDAARRIFVVRDSKLVAMPRGMVMMAPSDWPAALRSPLFSAHTKLRLLSETLWRPLIRSEDFTVGELVTDHFGSELLDYVAEPLLSGVYGGDSASLSAPSVLPRFVGYEQTSGSLIRGVREERRNASGNSSLFRSFRDGMQTLTDTLGRYAAVHYAEAERIERHGGSWRVHSGDAMLEVADIVLACPSHIAARLIEDAAPSLASELARIPYSSAILVTLLFERSRMAHPLNGFGFLVPRPERVTIAAATWVSTKFPSRIRQDLAAVRAFIVADNAARLRDATDHELVELVRSDLARFMGIDVAPYFSAVHSWPNSMPQYVVGHRERVRNIAAELQHVPGLHLVGNAYQGIGIPDCIRLAKETANSIRASALDRVRS